ncbi:Long-chain-fatty-acid--CoA ligase (EC [Olavius algarvensis associated proteobacterium Delta 3]|nr:Long-chain-fatty-acid--CoA ligase (EC [Olavius algarvensis associated proteobacterium Delta 3]
MEQFKDYRNIHHMLRETVDRRGPHPAYKWFVESGETGSVSWDQFYEEVIQAAKSFMALGIRKNDKVSIVSYSRYQWVLIDLALATIGAVTVGIYHSLPAGECGYIIDHADAILVFAEDNDQLEKLLTVRKDLPEIKKIVLFSGDPPADNGILDFTSFMGLGRDIPDSDIIAMADNVQPDDVAAIVYTSGTTGVPKGAMLTHDNITFTAQSVEKSVFWKEDDSVFLFLPLAHVFARTCVYTALLSGCTMTFTRSLDTLAEDLKATQPDWFPSVPRIYEKVYTKIVGSAEAKGGMTWHIFKWAEKTALQMSYLKRHKLPEPFLFILKYKLADRLVFQKIRAALGGRVRWCISGAAPLNPDIGKFFHGVGVLIVEGIGMTENTSFSNLNRYDNYRFGWVGPPGPGVEQKANPDGEILFRGRNVMKGYYKMPQETAETITEDGWLHTGDIGQIDDNDFLRITGRKKELIVTAGGKNIAPARIEGIMITSRYINQISVIGDRRPYLTALVTLNNEAIEEYAQKNNIPYTLVDDLMEHPEIVRLMESEVKQRNRQLASFETIKKISIVPEFTVDNGMMTPTMKVKKSRAADRYQDRIDAMYNT